MRKRQQCESKHSLCSIFLLAKKKKKIKPIFSPRNRCVEITQWPMIYTGQWCLGELPVAQDQRAGAKPCAAAASRVSSVLC
jgi:hypothetical protein